MTDTVLVKRLYDTLNVVTLKKMASAALVADTTGQEVAAVEGALRELAERNLIAVVGDSALPTDAAGPALASSAARHYDGLRRDPAVQRVADRFEDVNARFLTAMSAWQQVDVGGRKVPNDHGDAEYDAKIVARLERLVARLGDLIAVLAARDPRFGGYVGRFDRAMARVAAGDTGYVSSPTLDSVHNVWFEILEDLLRTRGRARMEGGPRANAPRCRSRTRSPSPSTIPAR